MSILVVVGGFKYSVESCFLVKYKGSFLAELFEPPLNSCSGGIFCIDRDGYLFSHVLRYLKEGSKGLPSPETFIKYQELSAEAKYFGLHSMERDIAAAMPDWCIVELNVGGTYFTTTKGMLCSIQGSALWQLFNPAGSVVTAAEYTWKKPDHLTRYNKAEMPVAKAIRYVTDRDGRLLIDRDGEMFGYILTVLRTGSLLCPREQSYRIMGEVEFYGLHPLVLTFLDGQRYKIENLEVE